MRSKIVPPQSKIENHKFKMTAVPLPRPSPQSADRPGSRNPTDVTPVFALKELVARLHREQHNVQDMLGSLAFALRSLNNLNQFLELVPLVATRVTDADGGALVLFKPNGQVRFQQLHCQEGRQCQDMRKALEIATRQVSADAGTTLEPATDAAGQVSSLDIQLSNYFGPDVHLFGASILVKNSERGRLYVFSKDPQLVRSAGRQKLVRLVADQTAVAIYKDELSVKLAEKERLDRELEIGAEIQLRLLPRCCPTIPGADIAARCETASRVGGDYYDFIPVDYDPIGKENEGEYPPSLMQNLKSKINKGRWSIAIGDVMGKGVPAGLLMTMTRGMLRAEVLNRHSPSRILQHLNRVMHADLENSHRFVTLFYSEYDPKTRILSYSNAAHHPPLLWRSATNSILRLDTLEGMLIGLDADSQYQEAQVQLQQGDTIIYYTDGFTDAANQRGDRFDEENLIAAFQFACQNYQDSEQILNYLFDRVQQFIGAGNRNEDDMTLVVLKIKSVTGETRNDS